MLQAVKDTGVVLAILTGVTVFLFVSNTVMADLSSRYLQGPAKSNVSKAKQSAALRPPAPTQQAENAVKSGFPDL